MAEVLVSAERFSSMLENRSLSLANFASDLTVDIDLDALMKQDLVVSYSDLLKLANRFGHPWPYLLVDDPEAPPKGIHDNRTLRNQQVPISATLVDQILVVERMLEDAAELFPDTTYEVPQKVITLRTPALEAAKAVRSFLGVEAEAQIKANGPYGSLRLWSDALQSRGVYVSMRRIQAYRP